MAFTTVSSWWNRASSLITSKWSATPTPVVPWLLLAENTKENPNCVRKVFDVSSNKCYELSLPETFGTRCWGTAYGWVVVVDRDFNIQLFNPITKAQICFPSLKTIVELQCGKWFDDIIWFLKSFITKVIVLKVPKGNWHEFVIIVVHGGRVDFARHGNQAWTPIFVKTGEEYKWESIVDVVAMDDNVFGFYYDGTIVYWNVLEFNGFELIKPIDYSPPQPEIIKQLGQGIRATYLVQSGMDLLMVLRYKEEVVVDLNMGDYSYRTTNFGVYRLNPKEKSWEKIEDLGDVALFVGNNLSISVDGALAKNLQSSCIYFTDDEYQFLELPRQFGGHDLGVYDMKSANISPFYEGSDIRSSFCPPTWFIPQP